MTATSLIPLIPQIFTPNKKHPRTLLAYLTCQEMQILIFQPEASTIIGFRNAILLTVLHDTASRVQELLNSRVKDVRLSSPAVIRLHGTGNKIRQVSLMSKTSENLSLNHEMKKHHSGISRGGNHLFDALTPDLLRYSLCLIVSDALSTVHLPAVNLQTCADHTGMIFSHSRRKSMKTILTKDC